MTGPGDPIRWSSATTNEVDWEAELGVVIGRRTRNVPVSGALDAVFGYTVVNDVTARDIQQREEPWIRAKSLDSFCPIGPTVVSADEIGDPQGLAIRSRVNGIVMQDSTTEEMVFSVAELIAHISSTLTLEPGDVIATGTPFGVGAWRDPPIHLSDGDVVEAEIEGIGVLRNPCAVEDDDGDHPQHLGPSAALAQVDRPREAGGS